MKPLLLLIDDDKEFLSDMTLLFENEFRCITASTGREGNYLLSSKHPDVILLDLMLEGEENGITILKQIKKVDPDIPVFMITDYGSIETAIDAIRLGAEDYISKTPNLTELKMKIDKSLKSRIARYRSEFFEEEINEEFKDIIGESAAAVSLKNTIKRYAANDGTVLITGESGVGKELVARKIHQLSKRNGKPFIAVNCAALPKDLLESELFGYERGAFTGAHKRKPGKFELAADGTLFLDEISELNPDAQVKLLRVLQEKEFERLGGIGTLKAECRILTATNRSLQQLIAEGNFRDDLFYRLEVLTINVPPLRERSEDIPLLADFFLKEITTELHLDQRTLSPEFLSELRKYPWRRNIRELKNYLTRWMVHANEPVFMSTNHLPVESSSNIPQTWDELNEMRIAAADRASRQIEKLFLDNLLDKFNGNITKAAEFIGMNRTNLHKMIKKCREEEES